MAAENGAVLVGTGKLMISLCIDTAGAPFVALVEGSEILGRAHENDERSHAEQLGVLVSRAAGEAGWDRAVLADNVGRICVGTGPGSFTALRAGLVFARTLGYAWNIPVFGVSTLDVLARQALDAQTANGRGRSSRVLVVRDAKRREVFSGLYEDAGADDVRAVNPPQVGPLTDLDPAGGPATMVGDEHLGAGIDRLVVDPAVMSRIVDARGEDKSKLPLEPLYLREPDVN